MSMCYEMIFYKQNGTVKVRISCRYEAKKASGSESCILLYWRNSTKLIYPNALSQKN